MSVHDREGKYLYVSPSVSSILGYQPEELVGTNPRSLIHADDQSKVQNFREGIEQQSLQENPLCAFRMMHREAYWVEVECSVSLLLNKEGAPDGFVASLRHIELSSRYRLLHMMAHEFRTPIQVIRSSAELLHIKGDPAYFGTIFNELDHLDEMVNEFLEAGKSTLLAAEPPKSLVQARPLIQNLANRLSAEYPLAANIAINELGEVRPLRAHAPKLEQVLVNILGNACKYSKGDQAPVVLLVYYKDSISIEIKDFGIGIPDTEKSRILENFYRASNARKIKGNGIGLPLVNAYVEKEKGKLIIESSEGVGTIVRLELPH